MAFNKFRNAIALLAVLALTFPLAACDKKETLARVGAGVVAGASLYRSQLDALKARGQISPERYASQVRKADALVARSVAFQDRLNQLGAVTAGNYAEVLRLIAGVTDEFLATLQDPDLLALPNGSTIVSAFNWAIAILNNASVAVAILFPPTTGPAPATSRTFPINQIMVEIPPRPKGL